MIIDFKLFQVPLLPQQPMQTGENTLPGVLPAENHRDSFSEEEEKLKILPRRRKKKKNVLGFFSC